MSTLTLGIVVIIYMFLVAYLGYLGYKATKNASDYLLGGRNVNPVIMALSYGATFISASAIVGFGGIAATFGMGIQWLCLLNMFMGVVIAFIVFGRKTRKMGAEHNAKTFPQLLGMHYKSRAIQIFIASIIFIGMPLYAAVVMKGGAVFIEQMFDIDLHVALLAFTLIVAAYVISGGIKGVLYTDALQAVIMFVCMLFLLFWFYKTMDLGFIEANQQLSDLAPLVPEKYQALGHQGWTRMPVTGSPQWYTLVTSLILGVGIGCLAQPQLVVRFMMVESTKQINRGVLIGCVFLIVTVGAIYHIGALSNLFFYKTQGVVASEAVKDIDKIIPLFINKAMPEWFGALFMLCILSASMSTLSAQFHTMGAAFGADVFTKLGRRKNENSTMGVRIGVLISILLSYIICYTLSTSIIARGTALFMGIC
nr:sodium:solute symporter family protein [Parabacteroides sp.]